MPLALVGAVAIGLSLGLLGSGGSILTVPVLVVMGGFVLRKTAPDVLGSDGRTVPTVAALD